VTQGKLSASRAVVVVQAHNLTEYDHQKQLHHTLLAIEEYLGDSGFTVAGSWAAGPCRLCEPEEECLGQGKCRQPKLRRYSMEGSGMAVFLTCDRIANITGDNSWRLELIENWGLVNQSGKTFKSVVAVAVS
jgi:predicted metal-binding protein